MNTWKTKIFNFIKALFKESLTIGSALLLFWFSYAIISLVDPQAGPISTSKIQRVFLSIASFLMLNFSTWAVMWVFWRKYWRILKHLKVEDLCADTTRYSLFIYFVILFLQVLTLLAV
jgi:hypothetical protein